MVKRRRRQPSWWALSTKDVWKFHSLNPYIVRTHIHIEAWILWDGHLASCHIQVYNSRAHVSVWSCVHQCSLAALDLPVWSIRIQMTDYCFKNIIVKVIISVGLLYILITFKLKVYPCWVCCLYSDFIHLLMERSVSSADVDYTSWYIT